MVCRAPDVRVLMLSMIDQPLRIGQALAAGASGYILKNAERNEIVVAIQMVASGKLKTDDIISHRLPLAEAPHGYEIFNKKEDNCTKVVLKPWE